MDPRFERLAGISRSHVYNLRGSRTYRARRTTWTKTKGSNVAFAVRKAPEPNGVPGFLRVDTVHQGDRDGGKGAYIVNLVDEAIQYEHVGVVRGISGAVPDPGPGSAAADVSIPGSRLPRRQRLRVTSTTGWSVSSRSRMSASSRGRARGVPTTTRWSRARTRAWCAGISATSISLARFADDVDAFARGHLSPFVNFHRPSLYATEYVDSKGKVRRKRLRDDVKTPYEKPKSLSGAKRQPEAEPAVRGVRPNRRRAVGPGSRSGAQRGPRRQCQSIRVGRIRLKNSLPASEVVCRACTTRQQFHLVV